MTYNRRVRDKQSEQEFIENNKQYVLQQDQLVDVENSMADEEPDEEKFSFGKKHLEQEFEQRQDKRKKEELDIFEKLLVSQTTSQVSQSQQEQQVQITVQATR